MCNACGSDNTKSDATVTTSGSSAPGTRTYVVSGMTCTHCVASVREEVGEVAGVEVLDVDLASGRLVVSGEAADSQDAIRAAVEAAGYSVAPS
ncbi:heavy-metal-associated domain-containing protein [Conexibacter arvalis]|uniref:Copper ion binding protein n=1 Tax=Conexibacter arvalis TaxID=912552 RepID=A0A840ILV1_9ACTN|nr:heavy metal-associated domain-containing protein [Conexibacter arvalis]MBB4664860.1 copper ion binding protein [Conexibacter arvalis]